MFSSNSHIVTKRAKAAPAWVCGTCEACVTMNRHETSPGSTERAFHL